MTPREGQMLRVAVVARSVYPLHRYGGLERHVYDLVRCLLARDVGVTLITPPAAVGRPVDVQADAVFRHPRLSLRSVPYTTFPYANRRGTTIVDRSTAYPLFGIRAGRVAARLVSEGALDIVHGLGASVLGYALGNSGAKRAPLVLNPQGLEEFGATDPARAPLKRIGYWPLRVAVRRCARAADCVIATDRSLLSPVVTHLRVRPEVVRVIPNAIDLNDCDRPTAPSRALELRTSIGLKADGLLLVSVGRLEANKGFDVLIRALRELAADGSLPSSWRWALIGDGPMRRQLLAQVVSAGLKDRTAFCGQVDGPDLHAWYEAATLFVHPTLYEGSSLVTLEAMAHRLAVIASRAGGLPDKVRPNVNGWLVEPGDVGALAAAIRKGVSAPTMLTRMGAESRAIVEREFSWSAATDQLLEIYKNLLNRRGSL